MHPRHFFLRREGVLGIGDVVVCIHMIAHIDGCIIYSTTEHFSSIIVAQDSDGVFLCAEFLRFCLFQYNLNSTFSICNSGQTLNSRLFREKN